MITKENKKIERRENARLRSIKLKTVNDGLLEALKYLANENNYNVDEETGYVEMKRPGGGYQKGIVLVSHNLKPWILAKEAIAKAKGRLRWNGQKKTRVYLNVLALL